MIHSENADTRLHPASLTKMMTLYVVFEAIEHGEISLDTDGDDLANAANEPPSKLGLQAGTEDPAALPDPRRGGEIGQRRRDGHRRGDLRLRGRLRAADEPHRRGAGHDPDPFQERPRADRGGASVDGARHDDPRAASVLRLSRLLQPVQTPLSIEVPGRTLPNTNRRFLSAYKGADGIKTGYTNAAGFNLVASAERGGERIIATVFGGTSTAARNDRVAQLLDLGFREAPSRVAVVRPQKPGYVGASGTTTRIAGTLDRSIRPRPRPALGAPSQEVTVAIAQGIEAVVEELAVAAVEPAVEPELDPALDPAIDPAADTAAAILPSIRPQPKPTLVAVDAETGVAPSVLTEIANAAVDALAREQAPEPAVAEVEDVGAAVSAGIILDSVEVDTPLPARPEVVSRISTSGGRHWGVTVGRFPTRDAADRMLIRTALAELASLGEALRKVVHGPKGFDANFVGLSHDGAELACRRLAARNTECSVFGPPG